MKTVNALLCRVFFRIIRSYGLDLKATNDIVIVNLGLKVVHKSMYLRLEDIVNSSEYREKILITYSPYEFLQGLLVLLDQMHQNKFRY